MADDKNNDPFDYTQTLPPGPGVLLVSSINLTHSIFKQSVILLCEHNDKGSFGLILNVPTQTTVASIDPSLSPFTQTLHQGGPVQVNTLHFIHEDISEDIGSREIFPGVWWGQDYQRFLAHVKSGKIKPGAFYFFLGYSGWSADQLANEIQYQAWYLTPATPDAVFYSQSGNNHWDYVLRSMGPEYALLADMAKGVR